jgi:hypothetical protein
MQWCINMSNNCTRVDLHARRAAHFCIRLPTDAPLQIYSLMMMSTVLMLLLATSFTQALLQIFIY